MDWNKVLEKMLSEEEEREQVKKKREEEFLETQYWEDGPQTD